MKIAKKFIGSKVYHSILNTYIDIEEGNEEKYQKLGLDVFEAPKKPKLKKDAKTDKKREKHDNSNAKGSDNDK